MQQLITFVRRLFSPAAIGSSGEGGAAVSGLIEPGKTGAEIYHPGRDPLPQDNAGEY